jgi:hypothetical protein
MDQASVFLAAVVLWFDILSYHSTGQAQAGPQSLVQQPYARSVPGDGLPKLGTRGVRKPSISGRLENASCPFQDAEYVTARRSQTSLTTTV